MQTITTWKFQVRWMIRFDLEEVLEIERMSYEEPWRASDFLELLRRGHTVGYVAEANGKVLGYMMHEVNRHSLMLLNLTVHPYYRRLGIGKQMIRHARRKLSRWKRWRIDCIVRETSLDTLRFLRACEFRSQGVLPNYFEQPYEDAIAMAYHMED
jgi:Acetyltransferases